MNEPAFPNPRWEGWGEPQQGMTLRDYFAAKALQGVCASNPSVEWTTEMLAKEAYELADEMLKAREK